MPFVSPVGGNVYNGTVSIPVGRWQGSWAMEMANVTTTGSGGGQEFRGFVQTISWSFSLPLDNTDAAVAAGFVPGAVLAKVAFKLGALVNKCDLAENTTIESVERDLDANGQPIGVSVRGRGGVVTLNTALPVPPPPP